jgi:anthranilate/para-aminobenzoate synthase component I
LTAGFAEADPSLLFFLRHLLDQESVPQDPSLPPFQGGVAGYFGYELIRLWESLPRRAHDDLGTPDIALLFTDLLIVFDHAEGELWLIFNPGGERFSKESRAELWEEGEERIASLIERLGSRIAPRPDIFAPSRFYPMMSPDDYIERVVRCQTYIGDGDIFQANLSHRFSSPLENSEPVDLYRRLSLVNPSPFAAYLDLGDLVLAGASPERLIKRSRNQVETRPIAGTRPRGKTLEEDRQMEETLLSDEKERAEHIMLVDLERNDLGKVCRFGSVKVDEWMGIERYSHVFHIVSNIRGELSAGRDPIDLLCAVFPGGTITGVPKVRCMEIIDELEPVARGPYTGAMGYISFGGDMDLSIIIRTLVIQKETLYLQVGAGIVADSKPRREYEETLHKAQAALTALARPSPL